MKQFDIDVKFQILLLGAILCRRNILLLTESNCSVLGGEDESLMQTNRPVEVMARMLGKDASKGTAQDRRATTAVNEHAASRFRFIYYCFLSEWDSGCRSRP